LTKEKATLFSPGRAKEWRKRGLEQAGQAFSVQVQGLLYPITVIYTTKVVETLLKKNILLAKCWKASK
jgi:hypothetical protein